jgi:hypothetical protein
VSTPFAEEVYRHQLKPVITRGAETMNTIFKQHQPSRHEAVAPGLAPSAFLQDR